MTSHRARSSVLTWLLFLLAVALFPACGEPADASGEQGADVREAATTSVLQFTVEGMHCEGCVGAITQAVSDLPGVTKCEVSLEEERAVVTVTDPSVEPEIIRAIEELTYTARPASGG